MGSGDHTNVRARRLPLAVHASSGRPTVCGVGQIALLLEVVGVLLLVPAGYAWLGRRARRRGIGGSLMAPLEEVWDPGAHRTNIEVQVIAERAAPAPAPGGPPD
jgi:hypothetical protein